MSISFFSIGEASAAVLTAKTDIVGMNSNVSTKSRRFLKHHNWLTVRTGKLRVVMRHFAVFVELGPRMIQLPITTHPTNDVVLEHFLLVAPKLARLFIKLLQTPLALLQLSWLNKRRSMVSLVGCKGKGRLKGLLAMGTLVQGIVLLLDVIKK